MARKKKSWVHRRLKLSYHKHTGRRLPRQQTSHGVLLVITLIAGVMMAFATNSTLEAQSLSSSSQSVEVSGVVPAAPPKEPATISQPLLIDLDTLAITGSKSRDTIVEIYNNNLLVGAGGCRAEHYSLKITPQYGNNSIIAKVVDNLGQYGPDSGTSSVVYLPQNRLEPQFLLSASSKYFGTRINEKHELELKIIGGEPPYAITVDWGDNRENDLVVHRASGEASFTHRYDTSGCYNIVIQSQDNKSAKAYFRTVVLVSSSAGGLISTGSVFSNIVAIPTLGLLWPLYLAGLAFIAAFWLGEKYQVRRDHDLWKTRRPRYS